jgi:hypothetical protein
MKEGTLKVAAARLLFLLFGASYCLGRRRLLPANFDAWRRLAPFSSSAEDDGGKDVGDVAADVLMTEKARVPPAHRIVAVEPRMICKKKKRNVHRRKKEYDDITIVIKNEWCVLEYNVVEVHYRSSAALFLVVFVPY